MTTDNEPTTLTEAEREALDLIVHVRPYNNDAARLYALVTAVERILAARTPTATRGKRCPCGRYGCPIHGIPGEQGFQPIATGDTARAYLGVSS